MARESNEFRRIEQRERDLLAWLKSASPECFSDQKHCEEGTRERVYWHYGYLIALRDVMRLMRGDSKPNTQDISDLSPLA